MARSSRDSNIYGCDETSMAESISDSALASTAGTEDVWGTRTDPRANSWDGDKDPQPGDVKVLTNENAGGGDNEALDMSRGGRHRPGPKTSAENQPAVPARFSGKR